MLRLILSGMLIVSTTVLHAETLMSEQVIEIPVTLSNDTVVWSSLGYSEPMVKIIVPSLADITFLNHRNLFAGGPCISNTELGSPDDLLQGRDETLNVAFTIKRFKQANIVNDVCQINMREFVSAKIRGHEFRHIVTNTISERSIEDCR